MTLHKYIFFLFVFLLTSCAMEEAFEPAEVPEVETELPDSVFFILADPAPLTRVTYAGDGLHADFEKEDLVGCFALNDDLTAAEGEGFKPNACYRVSVHTNIKDGKDRRFLSPVTDSDDLNKSKTKYLFYYPYDPEITSLDQLKAYTHSVNTDQNDRDRYEASDLLWDICTPIAELKSVEVEMDHAMAQIIVEVESKLIKEGTVPTLLNIPTTVSKLNLVKLNLDAMTSGLHEAGAYELSTAVDNVVMWEFGYATSGNLMFRAAVPANHTISSGSKILSLENPDGNKVTYRLSKGLSFEPGKTYLMTLVSSHHTTTPDTSDEESWVLDVLDPETMQPVGLLCREYLRFQPGLTENLGSIRIEYYTGQKDHPIVNGQETRYISSQAWVFYSYDKLGKPVLDEGVVLRFISDVRTYHSGGDNDTHPVWPEPHLSTSDGFFTPDHGHRWVGCGDVTYDGGDYHGETADPTKIDYYWSSPQYNAYFQKEKQIVPVENYMHGGKISWDGGENKISFFKLPEEKITNAIAKENGHIAIDSEGNAFVSYLPIESNGLTDVAGNKVAMLQRHYLIDRRLSLQRAVEEKKYPLVKIGYNQFWMSYSLRAMTLSDGTPLQNFNGDTPGIIPLLKENDEWDYQIDPGYVFPSKELGDQDFHIDDPIRREKMSISNLYNFSALETGKLLPKSNESNSHYYAPTKGDVESLMNYLGWKAGAKLMSRGIITRGGDMTEYEALCRGMYTLNDYNFYAANICGFDLRAEGYSSYGGEISGIGGDARILLSGTDEKGDRRMWGFNSYNVFTADMKTHNTTYHICNGQPSRYFATVRFFMKFDGQADTGGGVSVSSLAKGLATKSSSAPVESRDMYVGLEAAEE